MVMKKELFRYIVVTASAFILLAGAVHWLLTENALHALRLDTTRRLSLILVRLEQGISSNFLFLEGVAGFISMTPDITEEQFSAYAALVTKNKVLLKNVAAAPDLTIRYVYPLEGNRGIIGKNYRDLPGQWPAARKVVETGALVTAGPLPLVQGGTGLIGRVPVYVEENSRPRIWGIVSSVLDMDRLYQEAEIMASGLTVAIRKKGSPAKILFGDPRLFDPEARAVVLPVNIPGAAWEIAAIPESGWPSVSAGILVVDLLFVLLGLGTGYWWGETARKNRVLLEIRQSLDMSQAISHLGSWALDTETGNIWWSDETYRIFGLDKQTTRPTMALVQGMIPDRERPRVESAINQAIKGGGAYEIEHSIVRPNGETVTVEAKGTVTGEGPATKLTGTVLDITRRKRAENDLRAREEQMRAMARASHDALIMIDSSDRILFWSDMAEKMFGWTPQEAKGRSMHRLITLPEDQKKAFEGLQHFSRTGKGPVVGSVMEFTAVKKDGTTLPVERSVSAFRLGEAYFAVGSLRDITRRKRKEEQLKILATTDGLTGLYNRRRFMELAQKELEKSSRYGTPFSVITFDADKFKRINDTYGHDSGDLVLKNIADTTRKEMREIDFPARLGGEEFAVGLPHTDLSGAAILAERLRAAFSLATVTTADGEVITYTVSLGVACCPGNRTLDRGILMKQADTALYKAKEAGRNRVEIHPVQTDPPL